jgi:hypothetical protein
VTSFVEVVFAVAVVVTAAVAVAVTVVIVTFGEDICVTSVLGQQGLQRGHLGL